MFLRPHYEESNIQNNNEKFKKRNRRASNVNDALLMPSYDAILREHYCKIRCGRVRLDNYIGEKRFVDKSTAYGRGNSTSLSSPTSTLRLHQLVGEPGKKAVPVKWIRECQKRYQIFDFDEFRTTRCCQRCVRPQAPGLSLSTRAHVRPRLKRRTMP
eukprot:763144-Hanusia_phi.AAC.2